MKLFKEGKIDEEKKQKMMNEFPSLTDDDFAEENSEKLRIHLQQKLGKSKEELRQILKDI